MAKYKATFINVTKQFKTVEVPDDIVERGDLRAFLCSRFTDYGADNEEHVNTSLVCFEDVTPPEEHGPAPYADWYISSGALYFRSSKTHKDYQIMRLTSAGNDCVVSYTYAIVEMLDEPQGLKSYGKVIDTFAFPEGDYLPDYNEQYNEYISTAIQKYENGVADEQ